MKTPDLANRFRGTSPLESAGLAVASDRAISKHNIGFFSRGMTLGGVLSTDRQLNKATVDDIIKQFEERHRIPHRPAVLHSGLTWTQTQVSPKDADFSGLAQRNREEILSAFGVPPIIAGITDGVNYSTAEQQRKGFWLDVILPMLSLFADEFDRQIVRDPTIVSEFNVDAVEELKMAWDKKLESAGKLFGLGYTTNQINRHLDLGMDDVPWGDTPFLPMGLVPVNDLLASDTGTPQGDQGGNQPADAAASAPNFDRIQNLIERFRVDVVPVVPMESRSPAIAQTRNASSDQLQQILDIMSDDEGRFEKIIARYLRSGMKLGSQQIGYILGITVSFGLDDPLAVAFMSQKALEIKEISDATKEAMRVLFQKSLQDGEGPTALAKAIRSEYNLSGGRARTIARTELSQAVNGGRYAVIKNEGSTEHEWLSSRDSRVRETHSSEDGNVVSIDEPFPSTGLIYPGDPSGPASEIINCRCITLPAKSDRRMRISNRDAFWRSTVKQWQPMQNGFERQLRSFFYAQRKKILAVVEG